MVGRAHWLGLPDGWRKAFEHERIFGHFCFNGRLHQDAIARYTTEQPVADLTKRLRRARSSSSRKDSPA